MEMGNASYDTKSFKGKYLAHLSSDGRQQLLPEHLKNVAKLAKNEGEKIELGQLMFLAGMFHDFGKYSDEFQSYIRHEEGVSGARGSVNHSSAGARWIITKLGKKGTPSLWVEVIGYAISAHHGLYDVVSDEGENKFEKRLTEPECYQEICQKFEQELLDAFDLKSVYFSAKSEWKRIENGIDQLGKSTVKENEHAAMMAETQQFYLGCVQRLVLSMLIDADWTDTSLFEQGKETTGFQCEKIFRESSSNLAHYVEKLGVEQSKHLRSDKEQKIVSLRNQIRMECIAFAERPAGIYCLPVPTGGGKTLSGLAYALEYAKQHPQTERIIYVSHFLSVIEQNADVMRTALGVDSNLLLEHHSNVMNDIGDGQQNEYSRFEMNWKEPFICTTMVQFFSSLFSDKKECVRRFHRLKHAVVILDEVQSVPIKAVHTFNLMMNFLNRICHTTVILCTATQPELDVYSIKRPILYSEPQNMITDVTGKFISFHRVEVVDACRQEGYTVQQLSQFIGAQIEEKRYSSMLIILNSKRAVKELYDCLSEEWEGEYEVVYLTTNLCAQHRSDVIDTVKKELKIRKKQLIVSTSLIEAGVDLSVECVVRSLAGLDSIAQAAGRCNRHGEREKGKLYIVNMQDEGIKRMKELKRAMDAGSRILQGYAEEKQQTDLLAPEWMKKYYWEYFWRGREEMDYNNKDLPTEFQLLSTGFLKNAGGRFQLHQAYKTAGEHYRLIDNQTVTVIVPYGEGKIYIEQLDKEEQISSIFAILKKTQRFTVNLYGYKVRELFEKGIVRQYEKVPNVYIATTYDATKGIDTYLQDLIF